MPEMKVYLIGLGMGNPALLTVKATRALQESTLLVGAGRLLDALDCPDAKRVEAVRADDIVDALQREQADCASVVFSGDLGFFSGSTLLAGRLDGFEVESIPGISSLSYFCAKTMTSYGDAHIVSVHGRTANVVGAVQTHPKTFLLTGGAQKVHDVCALLVDAGLADVKVIAGERLSYDDERIVEGTAEELSQMTFADLAVMLVFNPHPIARLFAAPGLVDSAFARGKAPMTKEEVRELAIAKLQLRPDSVLWDIGAGTGSVTVEGAFAACEGAVYAVERNEDALQVLSENKERFGLSNVHIVAGLAPKALEGLPAPDCAFIGGSAGNLEAIVDAVLSANPQARIVATSIALETLSRLLSCLHERGIDDAQVVQAFIAKADKVGPYHMMKGANPIYIVSFGGQEGMRS